MNQDELIVRLSKFEWNWGLAPHLQGRFVSSDKGAVPIADLVTDQPGSSLVNLVTPRLTKLTDTQRKIIQLCEVPRKQADLMQELGLSHRTFFRRKHLEPLIQTNLVRMTHPEEPNHPEQAYVVTDSGLGLLASW